GDGNPVVSYYDRTNQNLKILRCNDAKCQGNDESITSPDMAGAVGQYTSLVLDGNGNPVVSYIIRGTFDLKIMRCNDPNCDALVNGPESITSPDTAGVIVGHTSLALDGNGPGNPVVSY